MSSQTARNPFDRIRPAGKRYVGRDESVSYCLKDEHEPAEVPPEVAKYRDVTEPGKKALHFAYRGGDAGAHIKDGMVFGRVFKGDRVGAAEVFDTTKTKMEELILEKVEAATYKSVKNEPLGRSHVPGNQTLPAKTMRPDFKFGRSTFASDAAKQAVFPPPGDPEEEKKEEIYKQSHHSFPPGVQRRDRVDWTMTGVDPNNQKFGRPMVSTERNVIVPKITEDFRAYQDYSLGTTRANQLTDTGRHPAVYGKAAQRSSAGDWGVADCFRGDFTREDQEPDRDLGRSVTMGYRNAGFADPLRSFGLPSVRTDVPARTLSVAATMDFGNGPKASELLFPQPYADHGVEDEDFSAPRAPGALRALFAKIGYAMSDAEFSAMYERAAHHGRFTPAGSVSVAELRQVMNEVLGARDAGEEPEWFTRAVDGTA